MATPVRTRRTRGAVNIDPITPAKLELPVERDKRQSVKPIATPGMSACTLNSLTSPSQDYIGFSGCSRHSCEA